MRAGSADVFQIFLVAGRADRPEPLLHHYFRKAHDRVQRGANLMRYAGQEIGLRRIGAFGGKTRRFKRAYFRGCGFQRLGGNDIHRLSIDAHPAQDEIDRDAPAQRRCGQRYARVGVRLDVGKMLTEDLRVGWAEKRRQVAALKAVASVAKQAANGALALTTSRPSPRSQAARARGRKPRQAARSWTSPAQAFLRARARAPGRSAPGPARRTRECDASAPLARRARAPTARRPRCGDDEIAFRERPRDFVKRQAFARTERLSHIDARRSRRAQHHDVVERRLEGFLFRTRTGSGRRSGFGDLPAINVQHAIALIARNRPAELVICRAPSVVGTHPASPSKGHSTSTPLHARREATARANAASSVRACVASCTERPRMSAAFSPTTSASVWVTSVNRPAASVSIKSAANARRVAPQGGGGGPPSRR